MKNKPSQNFCLFIVGPTASGKTSLSLEMAKYLNADIISADSRQVFRYMNIGTATPSENELSCAKHYFINTKDPDEAFSAGEFGIEARKIISEKMAKGENIIVCGGSGLYVQAARGMISDKLYTNEKIRAEIQLDAKERGWPALLEDLKAIDPKHAEGIDALNPKRVCRALEIWKISGQKPSELFLEEDEVFPWPHLLIGLAPERQLLYNRINERVEQMIQDGLVSEVKALLEKGYTSDLNALNTVGYKEIFEYLDGGIDLSSAIAAIQQNTRRFAKRQMTWFRKDENTLWFDYQTNKDEIIAKIYEKINTF